MAAGRCVRMTIVSKRAVMDMAMSDGNVVCVIVCPQQRGVFLPERFSEDHQVMFKIFPSDLTGTQDLVVDASGITCTLSSQGTPYCIEVPWSGVLAIIKEGDMQIAWQMTIGSEDEEQPPAKKPGGFLKVVK